MEWMRQRYRERGANVACHKAQDRDNYPQMDEDRSELLVRHDESRSQNHSFVVLTPRMIMAIMAKAMIKSAH
jgi:hypothetical protein